MGWVRATILVWSTLCLIAPALAADGVQLDWVVDRNSGCRVWNQVPEENEAVSWSGTCQNGFAQGRGVLQWFHQDRPAERYEGELREGKPSGHGVLTMRNGDRFDGEWRDGKAHGLGHIALQSGYTYTAIWSDGCVKDAENNVIGVGRNPSTCN
jgi:hypothetical protein